MKSAFDPALHGSLRRWLARHAVSFLFCTALGCILSTRVGAQLPDFSLSTATATGTPAVWLIDPAGDGPMLSQIGVVITLVLRDGTGFPITNHPFQDMWIDDAGNGSIALCNGGSVADRDTDLSGMTTFSRRIAGGGWTDQGVGVYVSGLRVGVLAGLDIVSPDLTGDRVVDLEDVAAFAVDFTGGGYSLRVDLSCNGVVDLADIGVLALHYGHACH